MKIKFHHLGLWLVILVFSLAVVLFPGCAPKAAPSATPTAIPLEPIKITMNTSLTGAMASTCIGTDTVFDLTIKLVNRAGGVNKGHPLQGYTYDNQTKLDLAVAGSKKAIFDDKASAITGIISTGFCKAIEPLTNENRVIFFPDSGGFLPTSRYSFKLCGSDEEILQFTLEWLKKQAGSLKLGYLASTDSTGEAGAAAMSKLAAISNVPLLVERFNPGDVDVKTQLTKLKGGGINALVIHITGAQAAMAARNALELGYKMPVVVSQGNETLAFATLLKDLTVDNLYLFGNVGTGVEYLPANNVIAANARWFTGIYEKETGKPSISSMDPRIFDTYSILISAIDAVGTDPDAIVNYLETNVKLWVGAFGYYTFSPGDHMGAGSHYAIHNIKGGKFILVQDSVLPLPSGCKTIPILERLMKIK